MKPELNTVQNVNKNVELVPISLSNMKYVPMKPEYQLNFAHVPMDIIMTIPNVKNTPNSVKLVQLPQIIVLSVLKDMMTHQLVNRSQLPNPLKLKIF